MEIATAHIAGRFAPLDALHLGEQGRTISFGPDKPLNGIWG
jgi:hypothetical protein